MNTSLARTIELHEREYARDDREDYERLRDAVRAHLANADRLNAIVDASVLHVDVAAFNRAEDALEASRNDLFCLVEDTFCLPAHELAKALAV